LVDSRQGLAVNKDMRSSRVIQNNIGKEHDEAEENKHGSKMSVL
jgi:hypothetical protein